jgi:hypothetical protein
MKWSGQKEFAASPDVPFIVNGSEAGLLKNYGPLSFLKVSIAFSLCMHTRLDTFLCRKMKTTNSNLRTISNKSYFTWKTLQILISTGNWTHYSAVLIKFTPISTLHPNH